MNSPKIASHMSPQETVPFEDYNCLGRYHRKLFRNNTRPLLAANWALTRAFISVFANLRFGHTNT